MNKKQIIAFIDHASGANCASLNVIKAPNCIPLVLRLLFSKLALNTTLKNGNVLYIQITSSPAFFIGQSRVSALYFLKPGFH